MAADLPPLDQLDPAEAWRAWLPDKDHPWNMKWAAHLFRRAGFGAPPFHLHASAWRGLQQCVKDGPCAAVEMLFHDDAGRADYERIMDGLAPGTSRVYGFRAEGDGSARELQAWWLFRMVHAAAPLREKLTLFWHNHFATSVAKVRRPSLMVKQNQLLRTHALGKFRPFLLEVSRDPAMLIWLDSNSNVKAKPNENYARELMELFTLGPGHYTEQDIREAARAFTGWHTGGDRYPPGVIPPPSVDDPGTSFAFNAAEHDNGPKTILGQTGAWNGQDVVRILLEQPAAARFLVRKLYRAFVSEADNPPDALLEPLAVQLRQSDYDVGRVVRTMLCSRLFYSNHAYRRRVKSPVEYVLGLVRGLDAEASPPTLAVAMAGLGQDLFSPPNVKGWDGGRAWLNSLTLVGRHNLAWAVLTGTLTGTGPTRSDFYTGQPVEPIRADVVRLVREHGGSTAEQQVDFLLDLLLQGDCDPAARARLVDYLKGGARGTDRAPRLLETVHSVLLMPEYQLA